ncbi:MAG: DUF3823 domain-containing protein [Prevotellaceae bacterium]|nr:DUF3823 domain-containing protein [Prevotellaceae bacterium]
MKKRIFLATVFVCSLCVSCEHDNFDAPDAVLSGRVIYNGNPVGVRSNGAQLELWQDGFALRTKIPVYIAWDGTFHAAVFEGEYKIVRLNGAPWENQPGDTIKVTVKGNTAVDVPVTPYFVASGVSYQKDAGGITATFTVQQASASATLESATLYLSKSIITDEQYNDAKESVPAASITPGQTVTVTAAIPESLTDYLFARIGVKAAQSSERCYTQPEKIQLR